MDKRYQVFVSSTYADLKDERQKVIQTLMEMDCIPAGMELFPAADEEQWEFIKQAINDCDYYLLIIGGRYGSLADEEVSYTEKEFDYAVARGIKTVVLVHSDPDSIPARKTDQSDALREKLERFRSKAQDGRLVKYWADAKDLAGIVALSLTTTIKRYPAQGWVRANQVASSETLSDLVKLKKENEDLRTQLLQWEGSAHEPVRHIAKLDEEISFPIEARGSGNRFSTLGGIPVYGTTWKKLFLFLAPEIERRSTVELVRSKLENDIKDEMALSFDVKLKDAAFDQIIIQFRALDYISVVVEETDYGREHALKLTQRGSREMLNQLAIKSSDIPKN